MRPQLIALFLIVLSLIGVRLGHAQDDRHIGLTMGYPAAVGVLLPITDRVAIRPQLSISQSSGDRTSTATPATGFSSAAVSTNAWQTAVGVSGLFYLGRREALRTYVSPGIAYSRATTSSSPSMVTGGANSDKTYGYTAGGSFGIQYSLARHIGVFGEVGVNYARTTTTWTSLVGFGFGPVGSVESTETIIRTKETTAGTSVRSGAGLIFFF